MNKQPLYDLPENLDELEPERRSPSSVLPINFNATCILKAEPG